MSRSVIANDITAIAKDKCLYWMLYSKIQAAAKTKAQHL